MFLRSVGSVLWGIFWACLGIAILVFLAERAFFRPKIASQKVVWAQDAAKREEIEQERRKLARSEQREAIRLADEAVASIAKTTTQIDLWNKEIEPLQNNIEGQRIANDQRLFERMYSLFREKRLTRDELGPIRKQIDELTRTIRAAFTAGEDKLAPPVDTMEQLRSLHARVGEAEEQWEKANQAATAIRRETERLERGAANEPLRKIFERLDDQQAIADLEIRRAEQARGEERAKKLKEVKEQEAAQAAARNQQLREEAVSADTRRYLGIFFERRFLQPAAAGTSVKFRKTFDAQPMSLLALQDLGALEASVEGLQMLAKVGADRDLPQPRWSMPTNQGNWSSEQQEFLKKAQELLRRLGSALVAEGLLSP